MSTGGKKSWRRNQVAIGGNDADFQGHKSIKCKLRGGYGSPVQMRGGESPNIREVRDKKGGGECRDRKKKAMKKKS